MITIGSHAHGSHQFYSIVTRRDLQEHQAYVSHSIDIRGTQRTLLLFPVHRAHRFAQYAFRFRIREIATAILGVGVFIVTESFWLFGSKADCLDLMPGYAQQDERALDGIGASLTKREIVFAASALVAMTFYPHS